MRSWCYLSYLGRHLRADPGPGFFLSRLTQRGTKVPPLLGRTVMANLSIRELLLLSCIGTFIASATYAVTLLH